MQLTAVSTKLNTAPARARRTMNHWSNGMKFDCLWWLVTKSSSPNRCQKASEAAGKTLGEAMSGRQRMTKE